jgi:hypothetical protein
MSTEQAAPPAPIETTPVPESGAFRRTWTSLSGFITGSLGVLSGLAPHVLHHVGLLAGVAFFAGLWGKVLFGIIGLAASVPFLVRLYRRFDTWRAPAIALVVFTVMFALSAFVIGPAISGSSSSSSSTPTPMPSGHEMHHNG